MKKHHIPVLIVLIAMLAGITAMLTHSRNAKIQQEQQQAAAAQEMDQARAQKMEDVLNGFLKSVAAAADDYKKQRKIMTELVLPENLSTAEYVDENYRMMQTVIPELRGKVETIMGIFRDTETQVREGIKAYSPEEGQTIMESWRTMRNAQADLYLAFFNSEADVLTAYEELMAFYYSKKGTFNYDPSTQALLFASPPDKTQEQALREKVAELEVQQRQVLQAQPAPDPSPAVSSEMPVPTPAPGERPLPPAAASAAPPPATPAAPATP